MPRPDHPADRVDHPGLVEASAPTASPWLGILARSAAAGSAAALILAVVAALTATTGTALSAAVSVVSGSGLVIVFFALSLLIGHVAGASNPSGALGLFVLAYVVKVVGFGAVMFLIGRPDWLAGTWFFVGALATVVVWQIAEIIAFSRIRTLLYDHTDPAMTPVHPVDEPSREER